MSGDIFGCLSGIQWAETRDTAIYSAQNSPPTTKNYLAPNVKSTEVEELCPRPRTVH